MADATEIVGLCTRCGVYVQPYKPGGACDMDLDTDTPYYHHRYRKRRVRICRECEMRPCFGTLAEWNAHQQWHREEEDEWTNVMMRLGA